MCRAFCLHFNKIFSTMKFSIIFCMFLVTLKLKLATGELEILTFNQAIHKIQDSGSNCVLQMAQEFFQFSSNILIATSGLNNVTNMQIAKTTDRMVLDKLMMQYGWTISTFISGGKEHEKSV